MSDAPKVTCCEMRRKVTLFLGPVLSEEVCGVSDTVLADFMRFDMDPVVGPAGEKKPVIGFRFCPWCGKPFTSSSETRTTAAFSSPSDESGEEWKRLQESGDDDENE